MPFGTLHCEFDGRTHRRANVDGSPVFTSPGRVVHGAEGGERSSPDIARTAPSGVGASIREAGGRARHTLTPEGRADGGASRARPTEPRRGAMVDRRVELPHWEGVRVDFDWMTGKQLY